MIWLLKVGYIFVIQAALYTVEHSTFYAPKPPSPYPAYRILRAINDVAACWAVYYSYHTMRYVACAILSMGNHSQTEVNNLQVCF